MGIAPGAALCGFLGAAILGACSLVVDTSDLDTGGAVLDGGGGKSDVAVPTGDATSNAYEAGVEASTEGGIDACSPQITDPAAVVPVGSAFSLRGDAVVDGTAVVITPDLPQMAGALWSNDVVTFERFDMTAVIRIEDPGNDGDIADGMTFAWVPGESLPNVGGHGGDVGLSGLGGFAVVVDTFTDPDSKTLIGVADSTQSSVASEWFVKRGDFLKRGIANVDLRLRVRLDAGGIVSAWLDGEPALESFAIPNYSAYRGHWGFTAGTGQVTSVQKVTKATFVDLTKACP